MVLFIHSPTICSYAAWMQSTYMKALLYTCHNNSYRLLHGGSGLSLFQHSRDEKFYFLAAISPALCHLLLSTASGGAQNDGGKMWAITHLRIVRDWKLYSRLSHQFWSLEYTTPYYFWKFPADVMADNKKTARKPLHFKEVKLSHFNHWYSGLLFCSCRRDEEMLEKESREEERARCCEMLHFFIVIVTSCRSEQPVKRSVCLSESDREVLGQNRL